MTQQIITAPSTWGDEKDKLNNNFDELYDVVNDQAISRFMDIGTMRIQWGYDNQGISAERTITLPAPFANTSYSVVLTTDGGTGAIAFAPRVGTVGSKTTTNFRARMALLNLDPSTMPFSWQAIGLKP
jgi:hypothetical protein